MLAAMDVVGNPSSIHAEGRAAKKLVERSRARIAGALGCQPAEIVFTSGATEAAAILSQVSPSGGICVDETAHDALFAHFDLSSVDSGVNVLAMGLANSETGVITVPPDRDVDGTYSYGARRCQSLFLDVTQAIGRIPWSFAWSGADLACLSAHKLGGPKGVGALIVRDGLDITPLSLGGGQEMGRRSGTENIIGINGFAAAVEAATADFDEGRWAQIEKLRNILETSLASSAKETIFVGKDRPRIPNTSCFATPGWKGETQVMQMDLAGFAISSGSACSSGKVRESRVLRAMGYGADVAQGAVRVSLGPATKEDDVMRFADAWLRQHEKFRRKAA